MSNVKAQMPNEGQMPEKKYDLDETLKFHAKTQKIGDRI